MNVEKDVVLNEIIKERIKENEKMFKEDEINTIKTNTDLISKIYLLGFLDNKI